ncbi:hypothetical protein E2562_024337 [Oryza meyeriana var. granulata]|uniref:Uncharacterized protein n=1 Tax=Oryza meyeriana var. granulata TaxID=110450 RepID=A0A6G1C8M9_9ORYZ|nr:hypothetical protein E2562_024337 [Oryza meyeriana var. granulata]
MYTVAPAKRRGGKPERGGAPAWQWQRVEMFLLTLAWHWFSVSRETVELRRVVGAGGGRLDVAIKSNCIDISG